MYCFTSTLTTPQGQGPAEHCEKLKRTFNCQWYQLGNRPIGNLKGCSLHPLLQLGDHPSVHLARDDLFGLLQALDGQVPCSRADLEHRVPRTERRFVHDGVDDERVLEDVLAEAGVEHKTLARRGRVARRGRLLSWPGIPDFRHYAMKISQIIDFHQEFLIVSTVLYFHEVSQFHILHHCTRTCFVLFCGKLKHDNFLTLRHSICC